MTKLQNKIWRGNIRELRNCIECLVVLAADGSVIDSADIPDDTTDAGTAPQEDTANSLNLGESERELIIRALAECDNNRAAAARALGISRRTLYRKLEEFGI